MSSNLSGISDIASKIQELCKQRKLEEEEKQRVEESVRQAETILQNEQNHVKKSRYALLKEERSRHGLELEYMERMDQYEETKSSLKRVQEEVRTHQETLGQSRHGTAEITNNVYTNHVLDLKLHELCTSARIRQRKERAQQRQEELEEQARLALSDKEKKLQVQQETKRVQDEIQRYLQEEQDQDELIAALSQDIKEAINKRTSLRRALQDAKESFEKAQEETLKWEQECVELTNDL